MRKILASFVIGGLLAGGVTTTATANNLNLLDDDSAFVALGFPFPFYGVNYTNIYVGSNGYITFVSGDNDFTETLPEFLDDQPRIAGLWDDLTPPNGGGVFAKGDDSSMVVDFVDVPEFSNVGSNTFTMVLHSSGQIDFTYSGVTLTDALVGLSPGGGLGSPGNAVNFSSSPTWALPGLGDQAIYEIFTGLGASGGGFDLDGTTISFIPAPGALALLGLAGLVSRRRRRA